MVNHNYWGYWFLLPLAIGLAAGADRLVEHWRARERRDLALVLPVALLAVSIVLGTWSRPPPAESEKIEGFTAGRALGRVALEPGQPAALSAGAVGGGEAASWLALATGRPALFVPEAQYGTLAASRPADLVLAGEVRCLDGRTDRTFEFRPAASLVDRSPALVLCRPQIEAKPDGRARR